MLCIRLFNHVALADDDLPSAAEQRLRRSSPRHPPEPRPAGI